MGGNLGRRGEICAAGGFDVAAEGSDANHLNEGDFDRERRGNVDSVHGIIGHVMADVEMVDDGLDVHGSEIG